MDMEERKLEIEKNINSIKAIRSFVVATLVPPNILLVIYLATASILEMVVHDFDLPIYYFLFKSMGMAIPLFSFLFMNRKIEHLICKLTDELCELWELEKKDAVS